MWVNISRIRASAVQLQIVTTSFPTTGTSGAGNPCGTCSSCTSIDPSNVSADNCGLALRADNRGGPEMSTIYAKVIRTAYLLLRGRPVMRVVLIVWLLKGKFA